jgi:outer membrane protein assembly factor BamD
MFAELGRGRRAAAAILALAFLVLGGGEAGAKKKKNKPVPSPQEAYDLAIQNMAKKHYAQARTLLQEALPRVAPEDRELLPKVQLAIGDAFYLDGGILNYGEAQNAYKNFLTYFPQHERAAYAQYMVGRSMFGQVLSPDRDQTMTLKAIDELKKVETIYPDSPYASQAAETIDRCHDRLAERERVVGHFYQRRKAWIAAIDRYKSARDNYPKYTNMSRLLFDLGTCYLTINQKDEAQGAFKKLAETPEGPHYAKRVENAIRDYDRRREKEGEKIFEDLGKVPKKKGT